MRDASHFGEVDVREPRIRLVPFEKIMPGTESAYLIKGLIPRVGLTVVWGPPKSGKSFWTFDVVMHIALGWEYRDRRVKQGSVVYVACEGARASRLASKHSVNIASPRTMSRSRSTSCPPAST